MSDNDNDREMPSEEEREFEENWPVFRATVLPGMIKAMHERSARTNARFAALRAARESSLQPIEAFDTMNVFNNEVRRARSATTRRPPTKLLGKRKSPDVDEDSEPIDSADNHSAAKRELHSSPEPIDAVGSRSGKTATTRHSGDKAPRGNNSDRHAPVAKKPKLAIELPPASTSRLPSAYTDSDTEEESSCDEAQAREPVPRSSSPPAEQRSSSPIVTASSSVTRPPALKKGKVAVPSSPAEDVSTWTPAPRRTARKGTDLANASTITTPGALSSVQRAASGDVYRKPPPPPLGMRPIADKGKSKMAPLPPPPPRPAVKKAETAPALTGKDKASGSKGVKNPPLVLPTMKKAASTPVASVSTSKSASARPTAKKAASTPATSASTSKPAPAAAAKKKAPAKKNAKEKPPRLVPKEYARWLIENRETKCRKCPEKDKHLKGKRILFISIDFTTATEGTRNKMRLLLEYGAELLPEWNKDYQPNVIITDCRNANQFVEQAGIKSLDEIPEELPIVTWEWTFRTHRPHMDFPAFDERIPMIPGLTKERIAELDAKPKKTREEIRRMLGYDSNSSRESSPEPDHPPSFQFLPKEPIKPVAPVAPLVPAGSDPLAEFYEQARTERNAEEESPNGEGGGSRAMVRHGSDGKELKGFLCDGASKPQENCPNQDVIDKLVELQGLHEAKPTEDDKWRAFSLSKTIRALKEYPTRLKSEEEAKKIVGVGVKTAQKIMEVIRTGNLRRIKHERTEDIVVAQLFQGIYGVGPAKAREWYLMGARTLDDLREGKFGIKLSDAQKIGLQYYDDINTRMPRKEAGEIFDAIKRIVWRIDSQIVIEIMGSYRRGKETCGDIDVFITRPKDDGWTHAGILPRVFEKLHAAGILTEDLSMPEDPDALECCYRGLCVLPGGKGVRRRIDILAVPWESRGAALIYYTGDDIFNRSLRLKAGKMGYSLNQRGLFAGVVRDADRVKTNKGTMIAGASEREIFEILGVPWQEPWQRVRN
ncbi:unnamed protein product [Peniophora sp. CBMAI 1063]|nr:unnamed protein product [Peniophora sp. CBMAI 1063]